MSLLNLENIPGRMISGLDGEMLDWVTQESNYREVIELSHSFSRDIHENEISIYNEFPEVDESVLRELDKIESDGIPKSTARQTLDSVKKFRTFLQQKGLCVQFEKVPCKILNDYLRLFYSELKRKDGLSYSPSSLIGIRAGLHRHLKSPDVNSEMNIISDDSFYRANNMLKRMVGKYLMESGNQERKQFESIEREDLLKIKNYFDRSTSVILQEEAWFGIHFHFGLRGREMYRKLCTDSLVLDTDSTGKRYFRISHDFLSKNVKESLKKSEYENLKKARLYEENDEKCLFKGLYLYLKKLTESGCKNELFPLPMKNFGVKWYCEKRVLGKNTFANMMSRISKNAQTSKNYTNHCIRVSDVTLLHEGGHSTEEIQVVTGHKNANSVSRYVRIKSDTQLQNISTSLHKGYIGKEMSSTSGVSTIQKTVQDEISPKKLKLSPSSSSSQPIYNFENCEIHFHMQ